MIVCVSSTIHGAGRTTFAKCISEKTGFKYISSGNIVREMALKEGVSVDEFFRNKDEVEVNLRIDTRIKEAVRAGDWVVDSTVAPFYLHPDVFIVVHTSIRSVGWRLFKYRRPADPSFRSPWDAGLKAVRRTVKDSEMFARISKSAPSPWDKIYAKTSAWVLDAVAFALGLREPPSCDILYVNDGSFVRACERAERIARIIK